MEESEIRSVLTQRDRGLLCINFLKVLKDFNRDYLSLNEIYDKMNINAFNLDSVMPIVIGDYLVPYDLIEIKENNARITNQGIILLEQYVSSKMSFSDVIDLIESQNKKVNDTSLILRELLNEIRILNRPRVFFNIRPLELDMLSIIIRNSGTTPAYDINCYFDPDLPYHEKKSLSQLSVFKNLPFLENGQEIIFKYRSLLSILNEDDNPKKTTVIVKYRDSKFNEYSESYSIDLEKYVGTMMSYQKTDLYTIQNELIDLKKIFEKILRDGILIKTTEDLRKEKDDLKKFYNQTE